MSSRNDDMNADAISDSSPSDNEKPSSARSRSESSSSSDSHRSSSPHLSTSSSSSNPSKETSPVRGNNIKIEAVSSDSDGELRTQSTEPKNVSSVKNGKTIKSDNEKEEGELEDGELETDSENEEPEPQSPPSGSRPRIVALPSDEYSSRRSPDDRISFATTSTNQSMVGPNGICKFFQRGVCTWGDACKFPHDNPSKDRGNWQRRPFGNTGRSKVISSSLVLPTGPVPLHSVNTKITAEEAWDRAVSQKRSSKRDDDSNGTEHKRSRRRRSSSRSSRSRSPTDSPRIPSLLDLHTKQPKRRSITPPRHLGPQVIRHSYHRRDSRSNRRSSSPPRRSVSPRAHRDRRLSPSSSRATNKPPSSADLSSFKIPKLARAVEAVRRSVFGKKNPSKRDVNRYFENHDDDKPAAYRRKNSKKRVISTSSSSSATSSVRSKSNSVSSTSTSSSSTKNRRKNKKTKSIVAHAGIEVQAVSSESDDEVQVSKKQKNSTTTPVPQRVSSDSSEGEIVDRKRRRSASSESSNKRKRKRKSSDSSWRSTPPPPPNNEDDEMRRVAEQLAHENAVLAVDLESTLEMRQSAHLQQQTN
ncbi:hypothetical protein M3Y98_00836400 [Aphelenchoides besseyi]|nr:hypothetical protein M3Y98_00836400 [Aphelenchoides besseyi]